MKNIKNWFEINKRELRELAAVAGLAIVLVAASRAVENSIDKVDRYI